MAKSKKKKSQKSMSQKVVGVATTGMPSPVKNFMGKRIIAALIVLCFPLLFATGVVSVEFRNGRPHFSFNKDKAAHLKEEGAERIHDFSHRNDSLATKASDAIHSLTGHEQNTFGFSDNREEGVVGQIVDRFESPNQDAGNQQKDTWSVLPSFGKETEPTKEDKGYFSSIKDRLDSRR